MKTTIICGAAIAGILSISLPCAAKSTNHGYPIDPVPFTKVKISDPFWSPRLEACRTTTIPLAFSKCEEAGRYDNFRKAASPSAEYKVEGFPFDDTDVYKTIEGASYLLQTYPDKRLEAYIDSVLDIVAAAQEPDGYLNSSFTMNPDHPHPWMAPGQRWEKVEELSHEFYNLGHMADAAVAHHQATGSDKFLNIARRYADCVIRNIGDGEGQLQKVPGHQIAEMALARLYLATGENKYLDQAKYFLDKRGHTTRRDAYSQAHLPVTQQQEAVGHAVRATYMYSGMADVAALSGDSAYITAIDRIWDNITGKKLYITGAIGARHSMESFGDNYELPNLEAYGETCAAIGNVYLNHRLFLLHGDARYYDVLERTLYNGLISGMSVDGGRFFYPNPLASEGGYSRKEWFGCACCPSNICRFMPSLPGYIYAVDGNRLFTNLYIGGYAEMTVNGKPVKLTQSGDYAREGKVRVTIDSNKAGDFCLMLRIPGWASGNPIPGDLYSYVNPVEKGFKISLNGIQMPVETKNGYAAIYRKWKKGDTIDLEFDMTAKAVKANENVAADLGRVCFERGPLVYCAEWPDNNFDIQRMVVNPSRGFSEKEMEPAGKVTALVGKAQLLGNDIRGDVTLSDVTLTLIPYYSWAHRGEGQMSVWLPADPSATGQSKPINDRKNDFEAAE